MTTKAGRQRGRPTRAEAQRLEDQIRLAAVAAFSDRGFDGVTMEEIARAAGVSKPTLYAHYPDKQTLFATVIPWALENLHWVEPVHDADGDDLVAALTAIARAARARALDPDVIRVIRAAIAESSRFPEIAARIVDVLAWEPSVRAVVDILDRHAQRGTITVDDAQLTAEQFIEMVAALPALFSAFGLPQVPDGEEERLQHAVTLFLHGVLTR